jgi:hypothetical protein
MALKVFWQASTKQKIPPITCEVAPPYSPSPPCGSRLLLIVGIYLVARMVLFRILVGFELGRVIRFGLELPQRDGSGVQKSRGSSGEESGISLLSGLGIRNLPRPPPLPERQGVRSFLANQPGDYCSSFKRVLVKLTSLLHCKYLLNSSSSAWAVGLISVGLASVREFSFACQQLSRSCAARA